MDSGQISGLGPGDSPRQAVQDGSSKLPLTLRCAALGCRREVRNNLDGFCALHAGEDVKLGDADGLANLKEVSDNMEAKEEIITTPMSSRFYSPSSSSSSSSSKKCVVRGCSNLEMKPGVNFCLVHDNTTSRRFQRTIDSGEKKQKSANGTASAHTPSVKYRCRFDGCVNKAVRGGEKGYCRTHGGGKRCHYGGCTKSAKEGGFCIAHGGGKRCIHSRCLKGAKSGDFCITHSHMSDEKKAEIIRNAGNAEAKRAQKVVLAEQRLEAKRLKLEKTEKIKLQKMERQARAAESLRKSLPEGGTETGRRSARAGVDSMAMGLATPPFANLRGRVRREMPSSDTSSETIISLLGAASTLGGEDDTDGESVRPLKKLRSGPLFESDDLHAIPQRRRGREENSSSSTDVASMLLSLHGN